MKKISVIVPCYNGERTLERCLNSILNQTYKNFELIIIDDGSTDNSVSIIEKFIKKDDRIRLFKKKNGGVGSARNVGLKNAFGDYIQFIDCDDDIHPNMFKTMLETAQKTNADATICRFKHCCFKAFLPKGEYNLKNDEHFSKIYLDFFTYNVPWNKLYKREVLTEDYDETIKIFEDGLFVLANLKNISKVVLLDDEFYNYFDAGSLNKNSAVNAFLKSKFWKTKDGYWYKFNNIKPLFDDLLKKSGRHTDLLEYARSFDMAFWELIKLIDSGLDEKTCVLELSGIFKEQNFIKSIRARGIEFTSISKNNVLRFVKRCIEEYQIRREANTGALYFKFVEFFYDICLPKRSLKPVCDMSFDEIIDFDFDLTPSLT